MAPDGDCAFSSLAAMRILTHLGAEVTLLNDGPFTRPEVKPWESLFLKSCPEAVMERRPLVLVVDCSTPDRPGECFRPLMEAGLEIAVVDHHSSGEAFAAPGLTYVDHTAVSTTILLDILREELGIPLDIELATYIYKGFATDTGFFHFINEKTGGETLRRVAGLVDAGVSPYVQYDEMKDGKPLGYFKGVAKLVDRVKSKYGGRLLYTYVTRDEDFEGKPSDELYSQLLQVGGVKVVLFLKEDEGFVDIGMRSKNLSGIDIGAFAATLGGGGHKYAAGAKVPGSLDKVKSTVLREVGRLLED